LRKLTHYGPSIWPFDGTIRWDPVSTGGRIRKHSLLQTVSTFETAKEMQRTLWHLDREVEQARCGRLVGLQHHLFLLAVVDIGQVGS